MSSRVVGVISLEDRAQGWKSVVRRWNGCQARWQCSISWAAYCWVVGVNSLGVRTQGWKSGKKTVQNQLHIVDLLVWKVLKSVPKVESLARRQCSISWAAHCWVVVVGVTAESVCTDTTVCAVKAASLSAYQFMGAVNRLLIALITTSSHLWLSRPTPAGEYTPHLHWFFSPFFCI